jgi:hypothetical protein
MFASSIILGGDGGDWFAKMVLCSMWVSSVGCWINMELPCQCSAYPNLLGNKRLGCCC